MKKTYVLVGVNTAISLLRPGAHYCLSNTQFIEWNDPRPAPSWDEIMETVKKIKDFEDTIPSMEIEQF
jgi:hypothetical protein